MPNPNIKLIKRDDLPTHMQASWDRSMKTSGEAGFIEAAGNTPELFDWYVEFYEQFFYGGRVDIRMKQLARLKLSKTHGCRF
jgi:hypothetical protein